MSDRIWNPSADKVRMWIDHLDQAESVDDLRHILTEVLESIPSFQIAQDPCDWNPEKIEAICSADESHARAELIVGADGQWRLCRACAGLPKFKRFTTRTEVSSWGPQEHEVNVRMWERTKDENP